ncbi:FCD domain-containing protein [Evansella clarkii]|uniref:FCD domain-containing protein n=1 Tax=Evansella clarkii TaxID=79879 RepID=UPI000996432A|nr:FCD domain-containing protein [Evansella clarkii]
MKSENIVVFLQQAFSTKGEITEYMLLRSLEETESPVGSWQLKMKVEESGLEVSTATIGRILKDLDGKKYSRLVENQGRVLTPEGLKYVQKITNDLERMQLQQNLMDASIPGDYKELLDLVYARKTIENETARLAALRATDEQIKNLYRSIKLHEKEVTVNNDPTPVACEFHELVAEASQNRFLIASLNILIFEELKLESKISDLITREKGEEYGQHHRLITNAINNKDPESAVLYMNEHMEAIINAIEKQIKDSVTSKIANS